MNLLLKIVLVSAAAVTIQSCSKDKDYEPKPLNLPQKAGAVISADNTFGLDLYRAIAGSAASGTNLMISPLSVSQALCMTWNGANGETRTAMEQAMRISGFNREELNELNKTLVTALLAHDPKVTISIANSIWYRNDYTVLQDFLYRNQNFYNADVLPVDFSASGCKDMINKWVSDKTNQKITEIVDQINPESFMFLINAIYFKGAWTNEFKKTNTYKQPFFPETGNQMEVDMMHREMDLNILSDEAFTSIELPYGKGNWRMFIFLPQTGKTVADVEKLMTASNWESWLPRYDTVHKVQFSMPKFTFSYKESLTDALTAMGMGIAFSDRADLSGIRTEGGLMINDVKHKTFIEVNEEGTEAAAVTSVEVGVTFVGNFLSVNKPFIFAIAEKTTGSLLFIGRLMTPGK